MARTTEDPRRHFLGVRLTETEHQALTILSRQRGDRYLSDTLRSLIPRLRLEPAAAPREVSATTTAPRRRRRKE